mmetsp:Transcript_18679/g.52161  ORF Transcript_18679/g.52161 Transcript_18679/m.52161 type:complete len:265 (+) Transcript_18679:90-884(+)
MHGPESEAGDARGAEALARHLGGEVARLRELEDRALQIFVLLAAGIHRRYLADEGNHLGDEGLGDFGQKFLAVGQGKLEDADAAGVLLAQHSLHLAEGLGSVGHVADAKRHRYLVDRPGGHAVHGLRQHAGGVDAADAGEVLGVALDEPDHAVEALALDLGNPAPEHLAARVQSHHHRARGGVCAEVPQPAPDEQGDVRSACGQVQHSVSLFQLQTLLDQRLPPELVQAQGHPLVGRVVDEGDPIEHASAAEALSIGFAKLSRG